MRKEQIARLSLSDKSIDDGFTWENAAKYRADLLVAAYHQPIEPGAKFWLEVPAPIDADRIISHGHKISKRGVTLDLRDLEKIIKRAYDIC